MAQSCCNPFDILGHTWSSRRKNLRLVTAWMCERASNISIGSKICDMCRKKLSKESQDVTEPIVSKPDPPSPRSQQATESDPLFFNESVRKIQQEFGVSEYLARQSKKLVEEKGILSLSDPLRGPYVVLHCHRKQQTLFVCSMNQTTSVM